MTIAELGSLGEFVGSIAVFATLMFLALQIRASRRASEDAAILMRAQGVRDILLNIARDAELSQIAAHWPGRPEEEVLEALLAGDTEATRFANLAVSSLVSLQTAWVTDRSRLGQQLTRSRLVAQLASPGYRAVWQVFRNVHFYREFRDEVDLLVEQCRTGEVTIESNARG